MVFQDRLTLNAGQKYCRMLKWEHSAILSTFIKLPFVNYNLCVVYFWVAVLHRFNCNALLFKCSLTDLAIYGAIMLPTLANAELVPIPTLRITVGYNSADHTYSVSQPPVTPSCPSTENRMRSQCKAARKRTRTWLKKMACALWKA